MNRRVLPLFLFLVGWIALGCWLCKTYLCDSAPQQAISQSSLAPDAGWTITDGDNFTTESPDYFGFSHSSANPIGLSAGLENTVAAMAAYLKEQPNRALDITGYYMDNETNKSIMPSLGLARANGIKDLFVKAGVAANQMNLKDALLPEAAWANDTHVTRGIHFAFAEKATEAAEDSRLSDIKSRLLGKPIILKFGVNDANISLSEQQRKDMADIIYYLDRVADGSLGIGGHTDNSGQSQSNMKLSEERALSVKNYLAQKGLASNRMSVKGFGPTKPIASNESKKGRAENRRVEVTLK